MNRAEHIFTTNLFEDANIYKPSNFKKFDRHASHSDTFLECSKCIAKAIYLEKTSYHLELD